MPASQKIRKRFFLTFLLVFFDILKPMTFFIYNQDCLVTAFYRVYAFLHFLKLLVFVAIILFFVNKSIKLKAGLGVDPKTKLFKEVQSIGSYIRGF